MVKRGEKPVTTGDLEKYLADYSDFSFEIRVLRELRSLGFFCMHGGTYEDPITGKVRQFDIHATGGIGHGERVVDLELAVECKNVGEKFPLLIHAVPRSPAESFIEAVRSFYPPTTVGLIPPLSYCSSSVRLWGERYPSDVPVGKSCEQVGIDSSGKIFSGDNSVFDRISQCLNSAQQLLSKAHYAAGPDQPIAIAIVVPVLVVPAGRTWLVVYDDEGHVVEGPTKVKNVQYFVDRNWAVGNPRHELTVPYSLSHIEICEIDYLHTLLESYCDDHRLSFESLDSVHQRAANRASLTD